ncbi:MAG: hypothetical protein HYU64_13895 [Armatimonadetes bacterium]|nr:hypothetical protein [Armatimonadota bacterium]
MKERAEKVLNGQISPSDFLATLKKKDAIIARAQEQYYATEIEEELTPEAVRGIDSLGDGLSEYREALGVMAGYLLDGDPSHIRGGCCSSFYSQ